MAASVTGEATCEPQPVASTPWIWKTLLAKSRPIVVICIADGSHFARERLTAFTPWHLDAVSGSHPPHLLCPNNEHNLVALQLAEMGQAQTSNGAACCGDPML